MIEKLEPILALLREHHIPFWADSGTLLGLYRNKQLIDWDSDIDFGAWDDSVETIHKLEPQIRKLGYSVKTRYYHKQVYGFTFESYRHKELLPIHIHIYTNWNGYAWSPQTVIYFPGTSATPPWVEENPSVTRDFLTCCKKHALRFRDKKPMSPLEKILILCSCYPIWGAFIVSKSRLDRYHWAHRWPYKYFHKTYTWRIQEEFFTSLVEFQIGSIHIPIPQLTEEYLTARYGDWKTPDKDWVYWRDDGCLLQQAPEELVSEYWGKP
jgi:hypothetical protein